MTPTKDEVLKDLIEFFLEEFSNDPERVGEWLIQSDWNADEFLADIQKLKRELALR